MANRVALRISPVSSVSTHQRFMFIFILLCTTRITAGRDSSVGISDPLWAGRSGDRIPVGARFSAPVHNGPGAHPGPIQWVQGPSPGIKRPGCGVNHPPHLAPRLKKEWSYTATLPLGPLTCSRVNFTSHLTQRHAGESWTPPNRAIPSHILG